MSDIFIEDIFIFAMTDQTESKEPQSGFSFALLKNEAIWIVLVAITLYLALTLITFNRNDSCWSHASQVSSISNLGGPIGAWLSDILLFVFGLSAWWIILPLIDHIRIGFKRIVAILHHQQIPYISLSGKIISGVGFILLLVSSSGIEYLRMYRTSAQLPNIPGGVVGEIIGQLLQQYFGFTCGTAFLGIIAFLSFSLCLRKSWISIVEYIGAWVEWPFNCYRKIHHARQKIGLDKSPQQTTDHSSPMSQEPVSDAPIQTASSIPVIDESEKSEIPLLQDEQTDTHFSDIQDIDIPFDNHEPILEKNDIENIDLSSIDAHPQMEPIEPSTTISYSQEPSLVAKRLPQTPSSDSTLPSLLLLDPPEPQQESASPEALDYTSRLIERKLAEFGVKVKVVSASPGPVVTRYEIEPAVGVKGSAIVNLSRDLARSLSLVSIRVVENVPGKTYMALELPNIKRQIVRLSEILNSDEFNQSSSNLTIALGKDIAGKPIVADLARMPHLLIAGTTGSGKSVGINATLLSLLYKATPDQVRLILIDPKMLELSIYQDIPHLLTPVVIDMKKADHALNWAVSEMEKRYLLMSKMGVRNLTGFNKRIEDAAAKGEKIFNPFSLTPESPEPLEKLPQIVIIVDEFSDLMMTVGKKVEQSIARIAQKARAAGIHLILATQRPSVDVITGLIKANIPTRIAFQVSSKVDSRTILDQTGAETLLGLGDMLYLPPGTSLPTRVHGAFVSDEEVTNIVAFLRQQGEPNYIDGILEGNINDEKEGDNNGYALDDESDEKYDEAVAIVLKNKKASISLVQRHLRIGYNRAARLLEQMERSGLVSPMKSNGTRDVIVPTSSEEF